jgi:hypothetical protein
MGQFAQQSLRLRLPGCRQQLDEMLLLRMEGAQQGLCFFIHL